MDDKKLDIDVLIGHTLRGWTLADPKRLILYCDDHQWVVQVDDDGAGGNDSYASVTDVRLTDLIGETITGARHEGGGDDVGLLLEAGDRRGSITLRHDHNGYYGWSYEVVPHSPTDA